MEQAGMGAAADLVRPTVEEIGKGIAKSLKRQFNYLCCFTDNINSLKEEAKSLEDQSAELQGKVDVAESNAQVILPKVETWFTKMDELQGKKREIEAEIPNSQSPCLNISSRYSLSKKAKETAEAMEKLRNTNLDPIAKPAPPASRLPIRLRHTVEFQSRKDIEDDIVKSFTSQGSNIVGIGGMGGVGKTTMAEKIMHRMLTEKSVDEAIKVVVGQQVNVLEIQREMAEQLGFTELEKWKTPQERANQLFNRLTSKRILIVLDDIWETLNLGDLGIPFEGGSGGCLILLTSRDLEVLNQMKAQPSEMKHLEENEAWSLFKDTAGACVDDPDLVSTANQVVKECKGLPVAIVTVGKALKDKKKSIWRNAWQELISANPKNLPSVLNEVYKPLRLSYTFLQDDAKSLFLLCSVFPDDFEISLDDLALYSLGLNMFEGCDSLGGVRDKVDTVVTALKSCFLLLDCDDENKVKMHDVIRDVAIFIAKEEGRLDDTKLKSERHSDRNCQWMSAFTSSSTDKSFDHLTMSSFPSLQFLLIHQSGGGKELSIADVTLLEGMQGLNVLSLRSSSFKSLEKSVALPKNLQTLRLEICRLKTLSFAGALLNLEILSCYRCEEIKELPSEIGNLKHLKLLDLSGCWRIERIAAGVMAKLVELEELKMLRSFKGWESSKVKEEDRGNVALKELESLQKLRCLEIEIKDHELAKEEVRLSANIVKYAIFMGPRRDEYSRVKSEKVLSLRGFPRDTKFAEWIKKLVSSTDEELYLEGEGSIDLDISQVYNKIKRLDIERCEISSVMDLVRCPNENASFGGLGRIRIEKCHKLRNLSWLQRGNDGILLPQLERLEIEDCEMMEEIVVLENEENNNGSGSIVIFSKLVELSLKKMPKLTAVVRGGAAETIQFPLLETLRIYNCPKLKSVEYLMESDGRRIHNYDDDGSLHLFCSERVNFGGLKELKVAGYNDEEVVVNNIWCSQISSCFFQTLETLRIQGCDKLSSLFVPSIVKNLVNLNELEIEECEMMEEVVVGVEKEREECCGDGDGPIQQQQCYYSNTNKDDCGEMGGVIVIFPKLKILRLINLPRLRGVGKGIQGMEFPMLRELDIINCPKLRNSIWSECMDNHNHDDDEALHLFCHQNQKVRALKDLHIYYGYNDEEVVVNNIWCSQISSCFFQTLETLRIIGCDKLSSLFTSSIVKNLVNLIDLNIQECENLEEVVVGVEKEREECCGDGDGPIQQQQCYYSNTNKDDCGEMGGIIVIFPKLKYLELRNLPRLRGVGKGIQGMEFPMLRQLDIINCPKLRNSIWSDCMDNHNHDDDEALHLFCHQKVRFDVLESLHIQACQNIKSLFSSSMVEKLVNLEYLWIHDCEKMEEVIIVDKERHEISKEKCGRIQQEEENDGATRNRRHHITFPKLGTLRLRNLSNLTCFGKGMESIEFPMLKELRIFECPELIEMVGGSGKSKNNNDEEEERKQGQKQRHDHPNSHLLCNQKVKFVVLEEISIVGCKSLRSLFLSAMVENLGNLKRLEVKRCNHMEKVITGDKEICGNSMPFPSLESIELKELPLLRMFCAWKDALRWKYLEEISIEGCPQLEFLTPGSITTPKLWKVAIPNTQFTFKKGEWNEKEDLNSFLMSTREESPKTLVEHGESSKKKTVEIEEIDEEEQT